MTINFDTAKNNINDVVQYLDETFFTDSSVTMMPDDYLKKSISERLCQTVFTNEGLVTLNEDKNSLSRAMLRSSLNDKDINFILAASLKISQVKVNVGPAPTKTVKKGTKTKGAVKKSKKTTKAKAEEANPDSANEMIKAKMESMCSIETLIGIIKDNLGTSRIIPVASEASILQAMTLNMAAAAGVPNVEPVRDMIYIERPLELNLSFVDLSQIDNTQIFEFLNSLMESDSNSSLGITLPMTAFVPAVRDFLTTDLPAICDAAIAFAKTSAKNSITFNAAPDPFKALFDTL